MKATQLCPALCDPMDCSPPDASVRGILQARILEWVAVPSSRGSSPPRDWTRVSCTAGRSFTMWATREAQTPSGLWLTILEPYSSFVLVPDFLPVSADFVFVSFFIVAMPLIIIKCTSQMFYLWCWDKTEFKISADSPFWLEFCFTTLGKKHSFPLWVEKT